MVIDAYSCDFTTIRRYLSSWQIFEKMDTTNAILQKYVKPICAKTSDRDNTLTVDCTDILSMVCKSSSIRVMKILRIYPHMLKQFMHEDKSVKIVHLIRDPRAIIDSREKTFQRVQTNNLYRSARYLCTKMVVDVSEIKQLKKTYSKRVHTLVFEHLVQNPLSVAVAVFEYLGFLFSEKDDERLKSYTRYKGGDIDQKWGTKRSNSSQASHQWWSTISLKSFYTILGIPTCTEIIKRFNYVPFTLDYF